MPLLPTLRKLSRSALERTAQRLCPGPHYVSIHPSQVRRIERPAILTPGGHWMPLAAGALRLEQMFGNAEGSGPLSIVVFDLGADYGGISLADASDDVVMFETPQCAARWVCYLVDQAHTASRCPRGYLELDAEDYPLGARFLAWQRAREWRAEDARGEA